MKALAKSIFNGRTLRGELIAFHDAERADIGKQKRGRIADASREITQAYKHRVRVLKDSYKQQDQERYEQTKAKSAEVWKDKSQLSPQQQMDAAKKTFDKSKDRRKDAATRSVFDEKLVEEKSKDEKTTRQQVREGMQEKRNRTRGRTRTRRRPR